MSVNTKMFQERILSNQDHSPARAIEHISGHARKLAENRRALGELVEPTTLVGRARSTIARIFPPLQSVLQESPMARLRSECRSSIGSLYQDLGELFEEGKARWESHNELDILVQAAKNNPDDPQLTIDLRERLRSRVEVDLNLPRDQRTEDLLAWVLETADAARQQTSRDRLIREADQLLRLSQPTIKITQTILLEGAMTFDSLIATYGSVLELSPALEALHKTSKDLVRGVQLGITAFNTMAGELDLAVASARLVAEAAEIGRELDRTTNAARLQTLSKEAEDLLQSHSLKIPTPQPQ